MINPCKHAALYTSEQTSIKIRIELSINKKMLAVEITSRISKQFSKISSLLRGF